MSKPELRENWSILKQTGRLPLSEPVPLKFIGRMAKSCAKEVAERDKAKAVASKNH